jgi:hypothetical protein
MKTVRSIVKNRGSQSSSGSSLHESESGVTARLVAVYDGYDRVTSASHIELSFIWVQILIRPESRAIRGTSLQFFSSCTLLRAACLKQLWVAVTAMARTHAQWIKWALHPACVVAAYDTYVCTTLSATPCKWIVYQSSQYTKILHGSRSRQHLVPRWLSCSDLVR